MDNLIEHLGINSINYFLYDGRPQRDPTPHFSELLHLNKPVGLERMVSLKGELRRVVIQQLRLLYNPLPKPKSSKIGLYLLILYFFCLIRHFFNKLFPFLKLFRHCLFSSHHHITDVHHQ